MKLEVVGKFALNQLIHAQSNQPAANCGDNAANGFITTLDNSGNPIRAMRLHGGELDGLWVVYPLADAKKEHPKRYKQALLCRQIWEEPSRCEQKHGSACNNQGMIPAFYQKIRKWVCHFTAFLKG